MSWNVDLVRFVNDASFFPKHAEEACLGDASALITALGSLLPTITWDDGKASWNVDGCSFECALWNDRIRVTSGPVTALTLWVRGNGQPMACIAQLCHSFGLTACDVGEMRVIDLAEYEPTGWARFRQRHTPSVRVVEQRHALRPL